MVYTFFVKHINQFIYNNPKKKENNAIILSLKTKLKIKIVIKIKRIINNIISFIWLCPAGFIFPISFVNLPIPIGFGNSEGLISGC